MIVPNSRSATLVAETETAELAVLPGLRWHQIDCGVAAAGGLVLNVDFGSGERTLASIDFTDTERVASLIFGDVKSIELVPTGVDIDYSVVYIATEA
jgi:hypothetical protein